MNIRDKILLDEIFCFPEIAYAVDFKRFLTSLGLEVKKILDFKNRCSRLLPNLCNIFNNNQKEKCIVRKYGIFQPEYIRYSFEFSGGYEGCVIKSDFLTYNPIVEYYHRKGYSCYSFVLLHIDIEEKIILSKIRFKDEHNTEMPWLFGVDEKDKVIKNVKTDSSIKFQEEDITHPNIINFTKRILDI